MKRSNKNRNKSINHTIEVISPTFVDCFCNIPIKTLSCGENHTLAITGDKNENLWSWGQHCYG